jgi:hypothetical protein
MITQEQIDKQVKDSSIIEGSTYMRKRDTVDELIRDLTKVFPRPKSLVRFRLWELQYDLLTTIINDLERQSYDEYYKKGVKHSIDVIKQYKDNLKK